MIEIKTKDTCTELDNCSILKAAIYARSIYDEDGIEPSLKYNGVDITVNLNQSDLRIYEDLVAQIAAIENIFKKDYMPKCKTCKFCRKDIEGIKYCFISDELVKYEDYEVCTKYESRF